jgi:hypothetical protein
MPVLLTWRPDDDVHLTSPFDSPAGATDAPKRCNVTSPTAVHDATAEGPLALQSVATDAAGTASLQEE